MREEERDGGRCGKDGGGGREEGRKGGREEGREEGGVREDVMEEEGWSERESICKQKRRGIQKQEQKKQTILTTWHS